MDHFLTVVQNTMQMDISSDPTGLGLCSMRSTLSELFVAPSARLRLTSLVNNIDLFTHHNDIP